MNEEAVHGRPLPIRIKHVGTERYNINEEVCNDRTGRALIPSLVVALHYFDGIRSTEHLAKSLACSSELRRTHFAPSQAVWKYVGSIVLFVEVELDRIWRSDLDIAGGRIHRGIVRSGTRLLGHVPECVPVCSIDGHHGHHDRLVRHTRHHEDPISVSGNHGLYDPHRGLKGARDFGHTSAYGANIGSNTLAKSLDHLLS